MATIKLIGMNGKRIEPHGSGWKVDGTFFANWSNAVEYAKGDSRLQVKPAKKDRLDRGMIIIAILAALMVIAAALASCTK
jgi:hypothetical protein